MADGETKGWSGDCWCTPPEIWERALAATCQVALLDPFPNRDSSVPAAAAPLGPDGFADPWPLVGIAVFVNPPFSRAGAAVRKCVEEWMRGHTIVAVIPVSLNASHWEFIDDAPAVCRPFRRISFFKDGVQKKGNRQDVVIVYWGADPWRFRQAFRDLGRVRLG